MLQVVKTVEGKTLTVRIVGKDVFINSAKVTTANVEARVSDILKITITKVNLLF